MPTRKAATTAKPPLDFPLPPKPDGGPDYLLLGAALALGTLTLASLGMLGLIRRLRDEVSVR